MYITTLKCLDITTIISKATFLLERINNRFYQNVSSDNLDKNLLNQRLQLWSKFLGGEDKVNKRLHWDELESNRILNILGNTNYPQETQLSSWQNSLKEIIQSITHLSAFSKIGKELLTDSSNPLPFEDFYIPFIIFARQKLSTKLFATSTWDLLSQEACQSLELNLLKQMVNLGSKTLLFEFDKYRKSQYFPEENSTQESPSKFLYHTFIQNLLQDGGFSFFQQYPVLGRLIATTVDFWVESTAEFIQRLQLDYSDLELAFSDNRNLGKVTAIDTSLSNSHNEGRYVFALTFASGRKIVYKPKDLELDVAFNHLLDWCNQQNIFLSFKLTKILNRQEYGWVEFIEHLACEDQVAVRRFYKRAGMLLSLFYLLGASDCHNSNFIANGEYPILIDADILMSPVSQSFDESEKWFKDSVLKTGFLPFWQGNIASTNSQDSSALGGIYPQQINSSREWKFINTDGMQLIPKTTIIPPTKNIVILDGKTVSPNDYLEEIVTGFEEMHRLLTKYKETLLGKKSPIVAFKALKSRFIFRPNLTYGLISYQSLSPQYLRNGIDYSILIDTLSRSYLMSEEKPETWELLSAEIKSLQQLDIPYLKVSCDSDVLEFGQKQAIKHFFKISSYQQLINRLQSLDEKDLALQIKLIRGSFYARFAHLTKKSAIPEADFTQFQPLTPEELLQEAIEIGNSLVANAIRNADGCDWLTLEYMFKANRFQLQLLGYSLYDGSVGVSIFLAALAKLTGKSEFSEVAKAGLYPLRQSLKKAETEQRLIQSGLGAAGLGGIIYSLVKINQFLQDPALLEDAQEIAKLVTKELIVGDKTLDIIGGVAGAILGLLSLYQETGEQAVLDIAIACGNHLLSQRSSTPPRAWKTISQKPLTGFSHGAAGNSFSLLRLYAATADTAYLEAAKEGIAYERNVFDTSAQNWPDFRSLEQMNQISFVNNWCHGSVGIGLARLGSLPILRNEEIYAEIEIALETTQKYGISSRDRDHLCCGVLGRTDLFVVAFEKLGNQEILKTGRKQAAWVLERAKQNREYTFLSPSPNSILSPSFFQGTTGVGYQFLRLGFPESLPSVLIWE
ncbi:MAG: type 2 lantipeptide synthetase LanM [Moorea sp. SIO2B7]|nr:type 2 lantipeptide synthetase LanM [Moorena sp. SIO2B7]